MGLGGCDSGPTIGVPTVIDVEDQDFLVVVINGVAHPVLAAPGAPLTLERRQ